MEKKWILGTAAVMVGGLLVAGCGDAGPTAEPAPTVTATATETVTATPEPEVSPDQEWLDRLREDHLDDLIDWYASYYEEECDASEPECYEVFEEGVDLMTDFSSAFRNDFQEDKPDYVDFRYAQQASLAGQSMIGWSHACPDRNDCNDVAERTVDDVTSVLHEALSWVD